jgi:HEAT repeat protein
VRDAAVQALGEIGVDAVPALATALQDEALAWDAGVALVRISESIKKDVPGLAEALKDAQEMFEESAKFFESMDPFSQE